MIPDPLEELTRRATSGDQAALVALLERVDPQLRARLRGKIAAKWQSVLELDDVLQVTYAEAFLKIGGFEARGETTIVDWLTRIAENNIRDAVKGLGRQKRPDPGRRVISQDAPGEQARSLLGVLSGGDPTASRVFGAEEAARLLRQAIAELPREYAEVVRLFDIEQRSPAEVAERIGRSRGAMYMLRARAHDRLRDTLGRESAFFSQVRRPTS